MNILICSVGRRVQLIDYFKQELHKVHGKIVAVDCDPNAPALHHADIFEVVPRIDDSDYISYLIKLCKKYEIDGVLSLIDPELPLLAYYKEEFEAANINLIVSDKTVVDMCFDKYSLFEFLHEHHLPVVPTYICKHEVILEITNQNLSFPLIIKPRTGSASIGIFKVSSITELKAIMDTSEDFIIQPFIDGDEYGIDCYIDLLSQNITNIFCKRKINMRAGETDKSIAIKDVNLTTIIEELINVLQPIGPIDIDCFRTDYGYIISEINPRFGGGYPHAHEMGQNFVRNIINNINGIANVPKVDDYEEGSIMAKYDSLIIINAH